MEYDTIGAAASHEENAIQWKLEADRTERHDLAAKHPERVKELVGRGERWEARVVVTPWATAGEQSSGALPHPPRSPIPYPI